VSTTVSSVTSGGILTVASSTGFSVNESVQLTGTPFGGLVANSTYWIISTTSSTITLSTSLYGSAISITGGSGSMTLTAYRQSGPGVGNTITANTAGDYNSIQAIAAKVFGPAADATPTYGYNQTLLSSQVPVVGTGGAKITQLEWQNLARDLVYARIHQTGNVNEANNLPYPTTSNSITESFRSAYYNYAQLVLANAQTADAGQILPVTVGTAQRFNEWNGDIYSTVTLDFGSTAAARGFYNAGGSIQITCSLTGSFGPKSTAKDNTWAAMFGAAGTITIGRNSTFTTGGLGTSGYTSTPTNIGFFQLTTASQLVFTETPPSGSYAANSFKIFAYLDATSRYMYLNIQYNDDSTSTAGSAVQWAGDEPIDGLLTQNISCNRANGSYVSCPPPTIYFAGDLTNMSGLPGLYGLSASAYNVNEGDTFIVYLQTQNVNNGTQVYYTVSGMGNTPNGVARYTATSPYFIVDASGKGTVQFTIANDLYSDGLSTMTITLSNTLASVTVYVNDTSKTPTSYVVVGTNSNFSGPGTAQMSGNTFTVPAGIYSIHAYLIGGGGGGGNWAGGGGGSGQLIGPLTIPVTPGQTLSALVGAGGNQGQGGGTTYFGAYTAVGGSTGNNGSGGSGGSGGGNGNGYGGGSAVSVPNAYYYLGGGGGGGTAGGGANASGASGGPGGAGTNLQNFGGGINSYFIGGGGQGGGSGADTYGSAGYGGGEGGGSGSNGSNGIDGTGGGGGGGGATVSGGTFSGRYSNSTITGNAGGKGGAGAIWISWP